MNTEKLQEIIVKAIYDTKGKDLKILDTQNITTLFDKLIIVTGSSNTHVRALAYNIVSEIKNNGFKNINMEGHQNGEWVIVDTHYIVIHIMQPEYRFYYNLEELWESSILQ